MAAPAVKINSEKHSGSHQKTSTSQKTLWQRTKEGFFTPQEEEKIRQVEAYSSLACKMIERAAKDLCLKSSTEHQKMSARRWIQSLGVLSDFPLSDCLDYVEAWIFIKTGERHDFDINVVAQQIMERPQDFENLSETIASVVKEDISPSEEDTMNPPCAC